jgi:hypothetical protein
MPVLACDKNCRATQFIVARSGIITDRFQLMSAFVAVVEAEGFAAGARRLRHDSPRFVEGRRWGWLGVRGKG